MKNDIIAESTESKMEAVQLQTHNCWKGSDEIRARKTAVRKDVREGGRTMSTGSLLPSVNICTHLSRGCVPSPSRRPWLGHTSITGFVTVINSSFYHL